MDRVTPFSLSKSRVSCTTFPPPSITPTCRPISNSIACRTKRKELMFFSSTRVPSLLSPLRRTLTFASQRNEPSSRLPSLIPR